MTRTYQFSLAVLVFGLIASVGLPSQANDCSRIDQLARDILTKSRLLRQQVHHYRHTPEYDCLKEETRGLRRFSAHILTLTRKTSNLHLIADDLRDLNRCFQRLERAFDQVELNAAVGRGRIYGPTAHVKQLLLETERCIRLMRLEVNRLRQVLYRPGCGVRGQWDRQDFYPGQGRFDQRSYHHRSPYAGRSDFRDPRAVPTFRHGHQSFDPRIQGRGSGFGIDPYGLTIGRGNLNFRINF